MPKLAACQFDSGSAREAPRQTNGKCKIAGKRENYAVFQIEREASDFPKEMDCIAERAANQFHHDFSSQAQAPASTSALAFAESEMWP